MGRTSTDTPGITADQFAQLMAAVRENSDKVAAVGLQVAEVKGEVTAYATGLQNERAAREALADEVRRHDVLLRGDGTKNNPGLADQIGDVQQLAETALKTVNRIGAWFWRIGGALLLAVLVDLTLRLLPHLYAASNPTP